MNGLERQKWHSAERRWGPAFQVWNGVILVARKVREKHRLKTASTKYGDL